jgi:hypothetical protein
VFLSTEYIKYADVFTVIWITNLHLKNWKLLTCAQCHAHAKSWLWKQYRQCTIVPLSQAITSSHKARNEGYLPPSTPWHSSPMSTKLHSH